MPSADRIAASFPHNIFKKINGTPSRIDIDDAQEKQTENEASRPSTRGGGAHGHAGMVVPPSKIRSGFFSYSLRVGTNPR